ncbi:MAG TPA: flagellar basal body rod protein FlgB [Desulfobacterales bacterium]|nr:flagellar basal body rod protein FlgB [Desulfobacterales bacterium]
MIGGPGFDKNFTLLEQMLTLTANKQKVIAHNIANVDTPGYRRKELKFEDALLRALEQDDVDALQRIQGVIVESDDPTLRNDGNNVDIDKEMAEMSQNTLVYRVYTELLNKKIGMLRLAMR